MGPRLARSLPEPPSTGGFKMINMDTIDEAVIA